MSACHIALSNRVIPCKLDVTGSTPYERVDTSERAAAASPRKEAAPQPPAKDSLWVRQALQLPLCLILLI